MLYVTVRAYLSLVTFHIRKYATKLKMVFTVARCNESGINNRLKLPKYFYVKLQSKFTDLL